MLATGKTVAVAFVDLITAGQHMADRGKRSLEGLSEVYSLIVAVDQIERAFIRDSIAPEVYERTCSRLLGQYNALMKNSALEQLFENIDAFTEKYRLDCGAGVHRIKVSVPATVENGSSTSTRQPEQRQSSTGSANVSANTAAVGPKTIAQVTSLFITAMDGLKLNFRAKDQLHPLFSELITALNRVVGPDFGGRAKLVQWLITLNHMRIDDELNDEQARQCLFDLDTIYKEFFESLE